MQENTSLAGVITLLLACAASACTFKERCPEGQIFSSDGVICVPLDTSVSDANDATVDTYDPCSRCTAPTPVCLRLDARDGALDGTTDGNVDANVDGVVCVECTEDGQCGTNRVCSSQNTCVECENDLDCTNSAYPRCDVTGPSSEVNHVCRASQTLCRTCNSDRDCAIGYRCARPNYMPGGESGNYCLPVPVGDACTPPAGSRENLTLATGATARLCQPTESISCGALSTYNNNNNCVASMDSSCAGLGALCRYMATDTMGNPSMPRCTMPCDTDGDCRTDMHMSATCIGAVVGVRQGYCRYQP